MNFAILKNQVGCNIGRDATVAVIHRYIVTGSPVYYDKHRYGYRSTTITVATVTGLLR